MEVWHGKSAAKSTFPALPLTGLDDGAQSAVVIADTDSPL